MTAPWRLLVADDNAVARKLVSRLLEKRGHIVLQAGDGAEALEQLRGDSTITALLLDLEMPIMGGLEASRAVRELEAAEQRARMPIVAVTGEEDSLALSRCREAGMDDWLSKPINIDELVALIGRLLDCQQA